MNNLYKIAVSIGMTNNVSSVVKVIQKDLLGLKGTVELTQGSFNRMKLAAIGAAGVFAGGAMLDAFKGLVDAGGAVVNQQAKMAQIGISHLDIVKETAVAYQNIAIAGSTIAGNMADALKLRSIFGGSGFGEANMALPALLKAQFALKGAGLDPNSIDDFIKPLDVMGAFKTGNQLDPSKFGPAIQMAVSAVLSSGGLLTGAAFQRAVQLAGPAAAQMGEAKFLQTMLEPLLALGTKAARGLQYAGSTFLGGQMSKATAAKLDALGLTSAGDYTHEGGRWTLNPNRIAGGNELNSAHIIDWIQDYFLPAAAKAGQNPLVAASTLPQTLQALISSVYYLGPQIARSVAQQAQANQADPYNAAMTALGGAQDNLSTAFTSLWQALGTPAALMSIPWINRFAAAIRTFTDWVGSHQKAVAVAEKILFGLGAALAALGAAAIVTALASMVGPTGGLVLLAGALSGLFVAMKGLPDVAASAEKALQTLVYDLLHPGSWIHQLDMAAVGGPSGSRFSVRAPGSSQPAGSISTDVHSALGAIQDWINAGAPTNVTNVKAIGDAASGSTMTRIQRRLSAPNSGPTGFNNAASPPGGAGSSSQQ